MRLDVAAIDQIAKGIGLDMKRFMQDRDSEATADAVARDRKQGEALQITSTPSLFINGRLLTTTGDFTGLRRRTPRLQSLPQPPDPRPPPEAR
jgi:protein-disulfide isomerase